MKVATIVYLHETFCLTQNLGTTFKAWQGVTTKPPKKTPKISFLGLKIGISQRNFNTVFFFSRSASGASSMKIEAFLGELGPKTPPKWPNSWLLHGTKTFENL